MDSTSNDVSNVCAYCAEELATEPDHVLARQFLPNELAYRDRLPQVPACGGCNRLKQKYEDSAAVILQLGHDSDASRKVLDQRVAKTLRKNARLARALREGARPVWVRQASGLLVKSLAIDINSEELFYINQWFRLLVRGFYRFEMEEPLPKSYRLFLVKPASQDQYNCLANLLLSTREPQKRSLAAGEFRYTFTGNPEDKGFTMWAFAFKSVEVFALTIAPDSPNSLVSIMEESEWRQASPQANGPAPLVRLL